MAITSVRPEEYSAWAAVWKAFIDHMDATLPESQYENSWSRIQDPNGDLHALVARDEDGAIVGLAHYLPMGRSWKAKPCMYLDDLFVLPSARGKGYGKQLLSAVAADAAAKGCDTMYWTTGHSNSKAQALYDRIAKSEQRWYYMGLPFKGWEADGGLESGSANRRLAP